MDYIILSAVWFFIGWIVFSPKRGAENRAQVKRDFKGRARGWRRP